MMAVSVPSCPGSPAFPLQPASRQETALSSGRKAGRVGLGACASTGADRKHVRVRSWRRKPDVHKEGGRENQPSGSRRRPASQQVTPSHSPGRSWGGRGGRHTQWEPRWAVEAVSLGKGSDWIRDTTPGDLEIDWGGARSGGNLGS